MNSHLVDDETRDTIIRKHNLKAALMGRFLSSYSDAGMGALPVAGMGAIAGGALGGLIDRRNRLRGILIGSVAGGLAGGLGTFLKNYNGNTIVTDEAGRLASDELSAEGNRRKVLYDEAVRDLNYMKQQDLAAATGNPGAVLPEYDMSK
jgi:hypothetical protein